VDRSSCTKDAFPPFGFSGRDHRLRLPRNDPHSGPVDWVIARRIGYGSRNPRGSRAVAVLASVIDTCRQRRHSPRDFLADVLRERRRGHSAPLLPAAA
jgi:hypothetical protein